MSPKHRGLGERSLLFEMLNLRKAVFFFIIIISDSNTIPPTPQDKTLSSTAEIMRDNPARILYS